MSGKEASTIVCLLEGVLDNAMLMYDHFLLTAKLFTSKTLAL